MVAAVAAWAVVAAAVASTEACGARLVGELPVGEVPCDRVRGRRCFVGGRFRACARAVCDALVDLLRIFLL